MSEPTDIKVVYQTDPSVTHVYDEKEAQGITQKQEKAIAYMKFFSNMAKSDSTLPSTVLDAFLRREGVSVIDSTVLKSIAFIAEQKMLGIIESAFKYTDEEKIITKTSVVRACEMEGIPICTEELPE
ncbi:hypothetical protein ADUPG1_006020 [Aduncisulcus paluster]|uniref:Uncharacterized protein n=1 Tax=Aduncisulcus paluster TaxID=2918883 RepID=A0ABQ5KJK6_9EUKA|nr:hypothetical protein ADUPG1_006020 [Aduncisulcus paluster]